MMHMDLGELFRFTSNRAIKSRTWQGTGTELVSDIKRS